MKGQLVAPDLVESETLFRANTRCQDQIRNTQSLYNWGEKEYLWKFRFLSLWEEKEQSEVP